jgi:hypothetical protein
VSRRGRWPVAALAVLACAAGVPGAAIGQDERKQDNVAVAVTEQDGARAFDFSWEVIRQRRGAVDSHNVANAAARCTDCRATAIAFQVVLAWNADEVAPRNQAVAINDQCTRCVVYAGARQFVRVVDGPARFTGEGRATLADVRNELRAIEGADLTVDEQIAIVEAQEARVLRVLVEEVVSKSDEGRVMVEDRDDREADDD